MLTSLIRCENTDNIDNRYNICRDLDKVCVGSWRLCNTGRCNQVLCSHGPLSVTPTGNQTQPTQLPPPPRTTIQGNVCVILDVLCPTSVTSK